MQWNVISQYLNYISMGLIELSALLWETCVPVKDYSWSHRILKILTVSRVNTIWLALLIRPLIYTVAAFIFTGLCFPGPVLTGSHSAAVRRWNTAWQPAVEERQRGGIIGARVQHHRATEPEFGNVLWTFCSAGSNQWLLHFTATGACECVFLLEQGLACVYVSDETPLLGSSCSAVLEALISFLFFWAAADSSNHHFQTPFHLSLCLGAASHIEHYCLVSVHNNANCNQFNYWGKKSN